MDESIVAQLDVILEKEGNIPFIKASRNVLGLSLQQAVELMYERSAKIGRPITNKITPPPTHEIVERVAQMTPTPVAFEAGWDGDSQGWMVNLSAIVQVGAHHHFRLIHLGSQRGTGGDTRLFNQQIPPWPEAIWAKEVGAELAQRFQLPFYFASPTEPNIEVPHWWEV